ncbi:MAG: hypothetical protein NUW37_09725 [Planctomycetes bacterium]|nr:hypothetical protein [Planctomycetota bacterium]
MFDIIVKCRGCSERLKAPARYRGERVACPKCDARFDLDSHHVKIPGIFSRMLSKIAGAKAEDALLSCAACDKGTAKRRHAACSVCGAPVSPNVGTGAMQGEETGFVELTSAEEDENPLIPTFWEASGYPWFARLLSTARQTIVDPRRVFLQPVTGGLFLPSLNYFYVASITSLALFVFVPFVLYLITDVHLIGVLFGITEVLLPSFDLSSAVRIFNGWGWAIMIFFLVPLTAAAFLKAIATSGMLLLLGKKRSVFVSALRITAYVEGSYCFVSSLIVLAFISVPVLPQMVITPGGKIFLRVLLLFVFAMRVRSNAAGISVVTGKAMPVCAVASVLAYLLSEIAPYAAILAFFYGADVLAAVSRSIIGL